MAQPKASRPHMPGYGILDADGGKGLLPWTWATERLVKAHTYWVATTRLDGAPHVMPVWGAWLDDTLIGIWKASTSRYTRFVPRWYSGLQLPAVSSPALLLGGCLINVEG